VQPPSKSRVAMSEDVIDNAMSLVERILLSRYPYKKVLLAPPSPLTKKGFLHRPGVMDLVNDIVINGALVLI
jgi:hypothetical protein